MGCYPATSGSTCQAPTPTLECNAATDITTMLAGTGTRSATISGFVRARDPGALDFSMNQDSTGSPCQYEAPHPSRVFKFTTSAAQDIDVTTDDPGTEFDSFVVLRKTDCTSGPIVDCNDDISFDLTQVLQNYRSHVHATNQAAGTYFVIAGASFGAPNANQTNAQAINHAYGNFKVKVTLSAPGSTPDAGAP
jgi:hypothetical protein